MSASPNTKGGLSSMATIQYAAQACRACRRLKRKCSKELPSCTLCERLRKECHYPQRVQGANLEDLDRDALILRIQQLERRLNRETQTPEGSYTISSSPFPMPFFLDPEFFMPLARSALYSHQPPPPTIIGYIGSDPTSSCQLYFLTVHQWFPFISRKRLLQNLTRFEQTPDADLALLLLCMKLVSTPLGIESPRSPAYLAAKSLETSLEGAGMISLPLLQATTLISLYEIGHGILPAGYMTLGQAARMGVLMSLHCTRNTTPLFKPPDTMTLKEEERRTWWAIIILERYINLGPRGLALATPEPCEGHLLPWCDVQWNKGEVSRNEPLYTTGFSAATIGQFARTAQAAHILGRVLYHRADRTQPDRMDHLREALQLHHTLTALENHIIQAKQLPLDEELQSPIDLALCCSARMMLYNIYGCNEPDDLQFSTQPRYAEESEMQAVALDSIIIVATERVVDLAQGMLEAGEDGLMTTSPLLIESIYHAATECQWFIREEMGQAMEQSYQTLFKALQILDKRWRMAGMYLELLETSNEC